MVRFALDAAAGGPRLGLLQPPVASVSRDGERRANRRAFDYDLARGERGGYGGECFAIEFVGVIAAALSVCLVGVRRVGGQVAEVVRPFRLSRLSKFQWTARSASPTSCRCGWRWSVWRLSW